MERDFKGVLWVQFGAAIQMLENAIDACPDDVWSDPSRRPEWPRHDVVGFWYLVYHTLFWLDFYLSNQPEEEFSPPAPFTTGEFAPEGVLPERPYTKDELRPYLEHCRRKCRTMIAALDEREAFERKVPTRPDTSVAELFLYNMRHVQHHAAQLNLILRQRATSIPPNWVSKAKEPLREGSHEPLA
jgi:DinB family protein